MKITNKNPITWFEFYVDNMPRVKQFYENVFAVELEKTRWPNWFSIHYGNVGFL